MVQNTAKKKMYAVCVNRNCIRNAQIMHTEHLGDKLRNDAMSNPGAPEWARLWQDINVKHFAGICMAESEEEAARTVSSRTGLDARNLYAESVIDLT